MKPEKIRQYFEKLDYGPAPESDKKIWEWRSNYCGFFDHFIGGEWRNPDNRKYF